MEFNEDLTIRKNIKNCMFIDEKLTYEIMIELIEKKYNINIKGVTINGNY